MKYNDNDIKITPTKMVQISPILSKEFKVHHFQINVANVDVRHIIK